MGGAEGDIVQHRAVAGVRAGEAVVGDVEHAVAGCDQAVQEVVESLVSALDEGRWTRRRVGEKRSHSSGGELVSGVGQGTGEGQVEEGREKDEEMHRSWHCCY